MAVWAGHGLHRAGMTQPIELAVEMHRMFAAGARFGRFAIQLEIALTRDEPCSLLPVGLRGARGPACIVGAA